MTGFIANNRKNHELCDQKPEFIKKNLELSVKSWKNFDFF